MQEKTGPVWVLAEQIDCRLLNVSLQLVGQARKLADVLETWVGVVLLGDNLTTQPKELIAAGADKVYLGNATELALYQPETYTQMIVDQAQAHRPEILLIGSTAMGRELAPLVAARLETGLTAHCIDLLMNEDKILEAKIPAYGGLISIICPERRPQMATVGHAAFAKPDENENRRGEIVSLKVPDQTANRIQTLEIVRREPEGVPLESAPIVVAGGAGAGDPEGWQKINDLARVLNAALGCTRPAVDEGWADLETMIGQSGKIVSPELYIGVGLSGELQHMVGITGARIMVAINNDSKSPVFEQVDLGIVDDCREFVPVLIERISAHIKNRVTC